MKILLAVLALIMVVVPPSTQPCHPPAPSSLVSSLYSTGKITEQTKGVKKPAVILKIKTKLVVMRWAPTAAAWLYHLQAAAAAPQAAALTEQRYFLLFLPNFVLEQMDSVFLTSAAD